MMSTTSHEEAKDTCLVGTLDSWPLSEICTWLHLTQRSAMLRVGVGLEAGVVFFNGGELYRAEWGTLTGEQALLALLDVGNGSFALIQRDVPMPHPNVRTPTAELLLRCAISKDERARARTA